MDFTNITGNINFDDGFGYLSSISETVYIDGIEIEFDLDLSLSYEVHGDHFLGEQATIKSIHVLVENLVAPRHLGLDESKLEEMIEEAVTDSFR